MLINSKSYRNIVREGIIMKYILKRIGMAVVTLFTVSLIVFICFRVIPGDAVTSKLGTDATPERVEAIREQYGLNEAAHIQYFNWIKGIVGGDMGMSYSKDMPVSSLVSSNLVVTLALAMISLIMIILLGVPIGLLTGYVASKNTVKASAFDGVFDVVNQTFMAVPSFFIGILISIAFGQVLKWFIPGKYVSYSQNVGQFILYLIPAAVSVAIPKIAMLIRFIKTAVANEMSKDYVRTAKSKGMMDIGILIHHVFKNAIITSVTALSVIIAEIFAGSVVVEQIFNLPGLERLLISSIGVRDYPVVMAIVMYIAIMIIAVNLLVDIIYRAVDPRAGGSNE